jgi:quercetin dioxygenase-like cupin family protein
VGHWFVDDSSGVWRGREPVKSLCVTCAVSLIAAPLVGAEAQPESLHSFAEDFSQLAARPTPNGVSHPIVDGKSATTGYEIEAHATSLAPGKMPHPPHRHAHDELFVIRTGTLELTINGQVHRLGPESVGLASNNDEHGIKNVGTDVAEYVIVAMGHR